MSSELHCTIVGAGIAGLATAIALRRSNHQVLVLEKATEVQPLGAGINLFPNAVNIFKAWGMLAELESIAFRVDNCIFRSYRNGKPLSVATLGQELVDTYGAPYVVVHRASLIELLLSTAKRAGANVRLAAEVSEVSPASAHRREISLTSGEKIQTDVIIGADGERSRLRQLIRQPSELRDSGDRVFRFTLPISLLRNDQNFSGLAQSTSVNFWAAADGHAIGYSLRQGDRYNMVFTKRHAPESKVQLSPEVVQVEHILGEFDGWDPQLRELLQKAESSVRWTLLDTEVAPEWRCKDGKLCLVGDAAHPMLPYLGQGAAMAIEDAGVLGELFSRASSLHQVDQLLAMFENIRKPRTTKMAARSKSIRQVLMLHDGPEQAERDHQLLHHQPTEGCANFLIDPVLSSWMFAYDALEEARFALHQAKTARETHRAI